MDPEFLAGSEHVAHVPVSNPTSVDWTYDAELYLVKDDTKYTSSGTVGFTLAAGASDTVNFPIVMPDIGGTFKVYLDIYVSGDLIGAYQATEDIAVVTLPGPLPEGFEIDSILAEPPVVVLGSPVNIKVDWFCPNPELVERTFSLQCVINGETLQHNWGPTTRGNGSISFEYTPASVGIYTATIPGDGIKFNCPSSVSFEVAEEVIGPFYSPYGEVCYVELLVPYCKGGYTPYETLDALASELTSSTWTTSGGIWKSKPAAGAGKMIEYCACPYCSETFTACTRSEGLTCSHGQRIAAVYGLLDHIQAYHPDHPLTIPRCHIETIVPEPEWKMEMGRNVPISTYALRINGGVWHSLGWKFVPEVLGPGYYEYQRTQEFVVSCNQHRVEIRGPVSYYYRWGEDPYDTPGIFDEDVVLSNLGDKAVFNVETGEVSIVEWQ